MDVYSRRRKGRQKLEKNYDRYQNEKENKKINKIFNICLAVFIVLFVFVGSFSIWFNSTFRFYTVSGTSMQPTINPDQGDFQDGVYVSTNFDLEYGDIIVLYRPGDSEHKESTIIKRVIATEGDYVTIKMVDTSEGRRYKVFVQRAGTDEIEMLEEDYIYSGGEDWSNAVSPHIENSVLYESNFYATFLQGVDTEYDNKYMLDDGAYYYKVGEDQVFFLGDNRRVSADARVYGCVNEEDIVGEVVVLMHDIRNDYFYQNEKGGWESTPSFWFCKMNAIFGYMWDKIVEFFSWN